MAPHKKPRGEATASEPVKIEKAYMTAQEVTVKDLADALQAPP